MKVFWVLGFDSYYPSADNFVDSFETREEAEYYVYRKVNDPGQYYDHYSIIDITERLY